MIGNQTVSSATLFSFLFLQHNKIQNNVILYPSYHFNSVNSCVLSFIDVIKREMNVVHSGS